jgi:uncharacterized protein
MSEQIPDYSECLELIKKTGMLENIKEHSILVMRVSLAITDGLKPGVTVDRALILAGALLHDITKTQALVTHEHHDVTGGEFLRSIGMSAVAEIVEAHVDTDFLDQNGPLTEKEIVHYADKRVKHASIVSLDQRTEDLLERYGKTEDHRALIHSRAPVHRQLEIKIESHCIRPIDEILADIR